MLCFLLSLSQEAAALGDLKTQAVLHRLRAISADAERRIVVETKDERDHARRLLLAARVALRSKRNVAHALRRYGLTATARDAGARLRLRERGMHDRLAMAAHAAERAHALDDAAARRALAAQADRARRASYVAAIEQHLDVHEVSARS